MGTNLKTKVISSTVTDAPEFNRYNPFRPLNPIEISSPGAGILYGVNHPGRNSDRYVRFDVPASWDQDAIASGTAAAGVVINGNIADGLIDANAGVVLEAELLTVIVLVNGAPIKRVSFDDTTTTGEFRIYDNAAVTTIEFGTAYGEGTKIEILLIGSAATALTNVTDVTGGALTANVPLQGRSYDFMNADVADVIIRALGTV